MTSRTPSNRFIPQFFGATLALLLVLVAFVTWIDPFRNLGFPWAIHFISDRNQAYRRFSLLEKAEGLTDLVVGSSTSEAFVPQVLHERYGVKAFAANSGGASLPLRHLMIRAGLSRQKSLKRILYVADFFEFQKPKLETTVFYQESMQRWLDADLRSRLQPDFEQRLYDYFSFMVIDRAFRTWKDYRAQKRGTYASAYREDGSTTQSMLGGRTGAPLEQRVLSSALSLQSIYGNLRVLDPTAMEIFHRLQREMLEHPQVELHLVLSPFHPGFVDYYTRNVPHFLPAYEAWRSFMLSLNRGNVVVHDFSYPAAERKGVSPAEKNWQDGTHFTSEVMLLMAREIYGR